MTAEPTGKSSAAARHDSAGDASLEDSGPNSLDPTRLIRGDRSAGPGEFIAGADGRYPFLEPPQQPDELGRLGQYRVLSLLGRGGMAFVFLAEDQRLGRRVALKVMRPDPLGESAGAQRFLREARLLAGLHHDHIVTVYSVEECGSVICLAMELLEGETLDQRVRRDGPTREPETLRIGREIATGLRELHVRRLIHRDLKPTNLWLESPGDRVKILDFGLARVVDDDAGMTQTGMIVGTPGFMSPEQARGEPLDERTDLFSLGAVLYCLVTGQQPFHATNTVGVLTALATTNPRPPIEIDPTVAPDLSRLIMALLDKQAERRPGSAEEVVAAIRRIESGERGKVAGSTQRVTRRRAIIAAGGALLFGSLGWLAFGRRPPVTFLADMEPLSSENWIAEPPRRGIPGHPPPPPFRGVVVRGRPSPRGIFMHPPHGPDGGRSAISYSLAGRFERFHSDVSINDGPLETETPVTFRVRGDGQLLWESRPVGSAEDAQRCDVDVAGIQVLSIEVECVGPPAGSHAVWIEPHLR